MDSSAIEILLIDNRQGDAESTIRVLQDIKLNNTLHVLQGLSDFCEFSLYEGKYTGNHRPDMIILEPFCSKEENSQWIEQLYASAHKLNIPCVTMFSSVQQLETIQDAGVYFSYSLAKPLTLYALVTVLNKIDNFYLNVISDRL